MSVLKKFKSLLRKHTFSILFFVKFLFLLQNFHVNLSLQKFELGKEAEEDEEEIPKEFLAGLEKYFFITDFLCKLRFDVRFQGFVSEFHAQLNSKLKFRC